MVDMSVRVQCRYEDWVVGMPTKLKVTLEPTG
jgi:hypothetical protein